MTWRRRHPLWITALWLPGCAVGQSVVGGARDAATDVRADATLDARTDVVVDAPDVAVAVDAPDVVDVAVDAVEVTVPCSEARPCPGGQVCVEGRCVVEVNRCAATDMCRNDTRCDPMTANCLPWDPSSPIDPTCTRETRPGVFSPTVQCQFSEAPAGDAFPEHLHVLSTPMVADLQVYATPDEPARPSIVAVFDDGVDGSNEEPTGLIRVLDGRTCALQDNLASQLVSHSSPPAVADLNGDGVPEIIAYKAGGGVVAFRYVRASSGGVTDAGVDAGGVTDAGGVSDAGLDGALDASADVADAPTDVTADVTADAGAPRGRWVVLWRSSDEAGAPLNPTGGGWAGPSVVDVDRDGSPEVLRGGMVFSGLTGRRVGGDGVYASLSSYGGGIGLFSIALDVDEDGEVELVSGSGVFAWSAPRGQWVLEPYWNHASCTASGCGEGHAAVANFGDFASTRFHDPALPEIAVVSSGHVRVDTLDGRTVFGPVALPGGGTGGPPTVADFDGDGLPEIAVAGADAYTVFDPDCGAPSAARVTGRCGTSRSDGILWSRPSQDHSSSVTGSTSFDFEADGRVEAIYADECFARVYDGRSGAVLFSQQHSSCTWYENPVVADVDGDLRAELVVGSNFNCGSSATGIACPGTGDRGIDVQFAGIRCATGDDCFSGRCVAGYCRCEMDSQCCPATAGGADAGADGGASSCSYVCAPAPDDVGGERTCRASRPAGVRGIQVYSDVADRWVRSRRIWNQHAYSVTNIDDMGRVPATAMANWRDRTLNNFRTNVQGEVDMTRTPDATGAGVRFDCTGRGEAVMRARVCNRGTSPLGDGLPVGFYDHEPAATDTPVCRAFTARALGPGDCVEVTCTWASPPDTTAITVIVAVDDQNTRVECHEQNNRGTLNGVVCRPPG